MPRALTIQDYWNWVKRFKYIEPKDKMSIDKLLDEIKEKGKLDEEEFEAIFNVLKVMIENIKELKARVKALEQKDSYYPTKEEIPYIKVGGTD